MAGEALVTTRRRRTPFPTVVVTQGTEPLDVDVWAAHLVECILRLELPQDAGAPPAPGKPVKMKGES